jgi:hypothetical protein
MKNFGESFTKDSMKDEIEAVIELSGLFMGLICFGAFAVILTIIMFRGGA